MDELLQTYIRLLCGLYYANNNWNQYQASK